jgi:hypothetical protein
LLIIANDAFSGTSLTEITVPESVTSIGSGAFKNCSSLTSATILSFGTSISNFAFSNCNENLKIHGYSGSAAKTYAVENDIDFVALPDFIVDENGIIRKYVGSAAEVVIPPTLQGIEITAIGENVFADYSNLTSISIPESVTSIGGNTFASCDNLTSVTIHGLDTVINSTAFPSGCTIYGYPGSAAEAFAEENGFTFVDLATDYIILESSKDDVTMTATLDRYSGSKKDLILPKYIDGYKITAIKDRIFERKTITSVVIPDSVETIGIGVFSQCTSLTSVTIPDSVKEIGGDAFYQCTSLTSITIPNSVTTLGNSIFMRCSALETVNIPDNESITEIPEQTFAYCYELENITIPDGITSIGSSAFSYSDLTSVTIPENVTSIGKSAFRDTGLTSVTIPENVTSIEEYAFRNTGLTSVTFPEGITTINDFAFYECESLTEFKGFSGTRAETLATYLKINFVDLAQGFKFTKDADTKTATITGYTGNAVDITIPEYIGNYQITAIGEEAFESKAIESVVIPEGVTSIGDSAFYNCLELTTVTFGDDSSLETIGASAFAGTALTSIKFPDSLISIGESAFRGCENLTRATRSGYSKLTTIGNSAFQDCVKLTSFGFSGVTSLGTSVLQGCTELNNAVLSASPEFTTIPANTFYGCTSLTYIQIYNNITKIESNAFGNCSSLAEVEFLTKTLDLANCADDAFVGTSENLVIWGIQGSNVEDYAELCDKTYSEIPPIGYSVTAEGTGIIITGYWSYLTDVIIPETIDNLPVVGINNYSAFSFSDITSVTIPASVTWVVDGAFYGCADLTEVIIYSKTTTFGGADVFTDVSEDLIIYGYADTDVEEYADTNELTFVSFDSFQDQASALLTALGDEKYAPLNIYSSIQTALNTTYVNITSSTDIAELEAAITALGTLKNNADNAYNIYVRGLQSDVGDLLTALGNEKYETLSIYTDIQTAFATYADTANSTNVATLRAAITALTNLKNRADNAYIASLQTQAGNLLTAIDNDKYAPLSIYADIRTALSTYADIASSTDITELNNAITALEALYDSAEEELADYEYITSLQIQADNLLNAVGNDKYELLSIYATEIEPALIAYADIANETDVTELNNAITALTTLNTDAETAYEEYVESLQTQAGNLLIAISDEKYEPLNIYISIEIALIDYEDIADVTEIADLKAAITALTTLKSNADTQYQNLVSKQTQAGELLTAISDEKYKVLEIYTDITKALADYKDIASSTVLSDLNDAITALTDLNSNATTEYLFYVSDLQARAESLLNALSDTKYAPLSIYTNIQTALLAYENIASVADVAELNTAISALETLYDSAKEEYAEYVTGLQTQAAELLAAIDNSTYAKLDIYSDIKTALTTYAGIRFSTDVAKLNAAISEMKTLYDDAEAEKEYKEITSLQTQAGELLTALKDKKYETLNIYANIQTALTTYANIASVTVIADLNTAITALTTLKISAENEYNGYTISDLQKQAKNLLSELSNPEYEFLDNITAMIGTTLKTYADISTSTDVIELDTAISALTDMNNYAKAAYEQLVSRRAEANNLLAALADEKYKNLDIYEDIQTALTNYTDNVNTKTYGALLNILSELEILYDNAEEEYAVAEKQGELATLVAALKVYSNPKYTAFLATTDFNIDAIAEGFELYLTSESTEVLDAQITAIESEIAEIETAYSVYISTSTTTTTSTTTSTTSTTSTSDSTTAKSVSTSGSATTAKSVSTSGSTTSKSVSTSNSTTSKSVSTSSSTTAKSVSTSNSTTSKSVSTSNSTTAKSVSTSDSTTAKSVSTSGSTTSKSVSTSGSTTSKSVSTSGSTTSKSVSTSGSTTAKSGSTSGSTTSKSVSTSGSTTSKSVSTSDSTTAKSVSTSGSTTSKSVSTSGSATSKSVSTSGSTTSKSVSTSGSTTAKSVSTSDSATTAKSVSTSNSTTSKSVSTSGSTTTSITDPTVTTTSATGNEEATTTSTSSTSTSSTSSTSSISSITSTTTTTKVTVAVKLDSTIKKVSPTSSKIYVKRTEGNAKGSISYVLLKGDYSDVDFSTAKLADMKNHENFVKLEYSNYTKNFNFNITHLDKNTTYTLVPFTVKMKYGYFGMGENVTFTTTDISLETVVKTVTADTAKFKISRTGSANGALGYVLLKGDVSNNFKTLEEYQNSENFLANQTSKWTGSVTVTVKGIESGETYTVVPYTQKGGVYSFGLGENITFTAE